MVKLRNLFKRKEYKKGYFIHETVNGFKLCRILNEYDKEQDAMDDLLKLLSHKVTQEDLLEVYSKKQSW
ncbi:MAG: hypothetical protein GX783_05555 [Clostridiales bacterium]|nr:hypothetical protein [Clostridiales bacterium]